MADDVLQVIIRAKDELSANVGKMDSSLTGMLGTLSRFAGVGTIIAGALAAVGAAAVGVAKQAASLGDEINRVSIQTGIAAEDLSALKLAAELNDSTLGDVSRTIGFLNRSMVEAVQNAGDQRDAYAALGISLTELKRLTPLEALELVAKRLLEIENPANRDAIALRTMGRAAREQLPFLQDLAQRGIAGFREEAERLGFVVTGEMARAGDEFNDNLTRMDFLAKALAITIGGPLVKAVNDLAIAFGLITQNPLQAFASGIDKRIDTLKQQQKAITQAVEPKIFGMAVPDPLKSILTQSTGIRDPERAKAFKDQLATELKGLEEYRAAMNEPVKPPKTRTGDLPTKGGEGAADKARKAIAGVTKSFQDQVVAQTAQIQKMNEGEEAALRYTLTQQKVTAQAELIANKIAVPASAIASWDALIEQVIALNREFRQRTFEKGPLEAFTKGLEDQGTSIRTQIVDLEHGADAAERHGLAMKFAAFEAEAFKDQLVIPDEARQQIDDLRQRILGLNEQMRELNFKDRFQAMSDEISDLFVSDREKEIRGIQRWGVSMQQELEKAAKDMPQMAEQINLLMSNLPAAMEQQLAEISPLVQTLDQLAAGAFDGLIDSITGAIMQGKSLSEVFANLGNSLLLGLNRAILQAAFAPLQEILHETFVGIAKEGGFGTWLGKLLGIGVSAIAGGAGGAGVNVGAGAGASASGTVTLAGAMGGVFPGHFQPLSGFRLRKFAAGGIASKPTFGLVGEGGMNEAVVPLPNGRAIPVDMRGGSNGVSVEINGDIIPRTPTMRPEDVIRIVAHDIGRDGQIRAAVQKHGRR